MRTFKKNINDLSVVAYNDSGVDWVVVVKNGSSPQRFPIRKWTLKQAMLTAAKIAA